MAEELGDIAGMAARTRAAIDERLAARDRAGAVRAALGAVRDEGLPVDALYTRVLSPLLRDTGAAWQQGAERVWEEHFATATVRTIVESLYVDVAERGAAAAPLGKTAVLACPSGESHELGLRMLADRLTLAGWNAIFLGADTPADEIATAARVMKADVVALSVATHYNRLLLRDVVTQLKAELPETRIGVGGPAFAHDSSWPAEDILTEADFGLTSSRDAVAPPREGEA